MKTKLYFMSFLLLMGNIAFTIAQGNYRLQMEQDFEKYKQQHQRDFERFRMQREEELRRMEQDYQDYYNGLHSLRNYYAQKNDTTGVNVVDELIEFEQQICRAAGKRITVTEVLEIEDAETSPSTSPQGRQHPTGYTPEKPIEAVAGSEVRSPDTKPSGQEFIELTDPETTFIPLPEEGNLVPLLTPLAKPKTRITSPFGMRHHPILRRQRMHNGIDFGSGMNARIFAAADGKVVLAQYSRTYGNWIKVEHANGYSTIYAHLSRFNVRVGDQVKKGDIIGYTGNTGRSTGPHLHYEVRINGTPVNPSGYMVELNE